MLLVVPGEWMDGFHRMFTVLAGAAGPLPVQSLRQPGAAVTASGKKKKTWRQGMLATSQYLKEHHGHMSDTWLKSVAARTMQFALKKAIGWV